MHKDAVDVDMTVLFILICELSLLGALYDKYSFFLYNLFFNPFLLPNKCAGK